MMCTQNKETLKKTVLRSGIFVCLFLTGCGAKYYYLVRADTNSSLYDRAISDFNKAIEIDPKHAMAYSNRGNAYGEKGQYDRAISDYTKAIEINPRFAAAYYNRGLAYHKKGEYDKAWEDVYKAQSLGLQVHPGFLKALREASGGER